MGEVRLGEDLKSGQRWEMKENVRTVREGAVRQGRMAGEGNLRGMWDIRGRRGI